MGGGRGPGLGELGRRVAELRADLEELRELVDGQEPWSHRKQLHALRDEQAGEVLLRQALEELRAARRGKWAAIREWASVTVAIASLTAALVISLVIKAH